MMGSVGLGVSTPAGKPAGDPGVSTPTGKPAGDPGVWAWVRGVSESAARAVRVFRIRLERFISCGFPQRLKPRFNQVSNGRAEARPLQGFHLVLNLVYRLGDPLYRLLPQTTPHATPQRASSPGTPSFHDEAVKGWATRVSASSINNPSAAKAALQTSLLRTG